MINFRNRFHGHNSLSYVYRNGSVKKTDWFALRYVKNSRNDHSRMAVVVGKKTIKNATCRNRIRRRVYECLRLKLPKLNDVYDIVVVVRSAEVYSGKYSDIQKQIDDLFSQSGLEK